MSEIHELVKLKPRQLGMILALLTPLFALPALQIFIIDIELFKELDTAKLMLLCLSATAPALSVFFGVGLIQDQLEAKKKADLGKDGIAATPKEDASSKPSPPKKTSADTAEKSLILAAITTAAVFTAFLFETYLKIESKTRIQSALITHYFLVCGAAFFLLLLLTWTNRSKAK